MNSNLNILDSVLVENYEALRCSALVALAESVASRGLALLMHKGMATWMQAWPRLGEPTIRQDRTCGSKQPPPAYGGVITLLAQMTLSAAKEVRT